MSRSGLFGCNRELLAAASDAALHTIEFDWPGSPLHWVAGVGIVLALIALAISIYRRDARESGRGWQYLPDRACGWPCIASLVVDRHQSAGTDAADRLSAIPSRRADRYLALDAVSRVGGTSPSDIQPRRVPKSVRDLMTDSPLLSRNCARNTTYAFTRSTRTDRSARRLSVAS